MTRSLTKRPSADHVRLGKDKRGDFMTCQHCGNVQRFILPMSISSWAAMAKAYARDHKRCKPIVPTLPEAK